MSSSGSGLSGVLVMDLFGKGVLNDVVSSDASALGVIDFGLFVGVMNISCSLCCLFCTSVESNAFDKCFLFLCSIVPSSVVIWNNLG